MQEAGEILEATNDGYPTKLEGGTTFPLEDIEELRLLLKGLMKPAVLDALLAVYKLLEEEPKQTEQFSWFVRNSQYGAECKYATSALAHFKKSRLDRLEVALELALERIQEIKGPTNP